MTSQPDRKRRTTTWIVIGLVALLAIVVTVLVLGLLNKQLSGSGPTASPSTGASATAASSATPGASTAASSTPGVQAAGAWTATGAMMDARSSATSTRLLDGRVLVAGGSGGGDLASAELYDPRIGSWTATGNLVEAQEGSTATLLRDGRVLVVGGISYDGEPHPLASAELYDPVSGFWSPTGGMIQARFGHTATLLSDGNVLVAGGGGASTSVELYNPTDGSWTTAGSMKEARYGHTATLLSNGRLLVVGGCCNGDVMRISAELYDPGTRTWTATGSLFTPRQRHTATLLPDGRVLVGADTPASNPTRWPPQNGTTRAVGRGPLSKT